MKEIVDKAKLSIVAYRVAIMWFCLFSFNALCSAILTSLVGKDWSDMKLQDQFLLIVLVAQNWTGTIMAFFSKQAQKVDAASLGLPTLPGGTEFVRRPQEPPNQPQT